MELINFGCSLFWKGNMNKQANIWCIIPAHNEVQGIEKTIMDLSIQSLPVNILVVADNCTDGTEEIVRGLIPKYSNLYLFRTVSNEDRKAGAINQAIKVLGNIQEKINAVLIMDADTRIDYQAAEKGWDTLSSDSTLAAVCSKAGVMPYTGKNPFEWVLYHLQRLEYSQFDSQRVETLGNIKVVHGMAALHRWDCILEVGGYDPKNLVEDYDLTIRYKRVDYKVTIDLEMKAWTEVPVKLKEWWIQRLRWNRGGLDTLKKHGWNKTTRGYILQHFVSNFLLIFQLYFSVIFIKMLLQGTLIMHGIVVLSFILSFLIGLYTMIYLENKKFCDWIIRILLIPEMLYDWLQTLNQYHAYYNFILNRKQSW